MTSTEEYKLKYEAKENRINAFNEFCKLRNKGLVKNELIKKINHDFGISTGTLYSWTKEGNSPYDVRIKMCPELFYVIGAILGDGCIYYWRYRYRINLVGDEEFTSKYAKKLSVCINKPVPNYFKRNRNYWYVNRNNVELFFMIKKIRKDLNEMYEHFRINNCRLNYLQFIEGFFDAEGCVKIVKEPTIRKTPKICLDITNTNFELLELIRNLLKHHLNIDAKYSIQHPNPNWKSNNKKIAYHLRIYKKEYVKIFFENIQTTKLKEEKKKYLQNWLERT